MSARTGGQNGRTGGRLSGAARLRAASTSVSTVKVLGAVTTPATSSSAAGASNSFAAPAEAALSAAQAMTSVFGMSPNSSKQAAHALIRLTVLNVRHKITSTTNGSAYYARSTRHGARTHTSDTTCSGRLKCTTKIHDRSSECSAARRRYRVALWERAQKGKAVRAWWHQPERPSA